MKNKLKLIDVIISFSLFLFSRFLFDKTMDLLCAKKDYDILLLGDRLSFSLIYIFMMVFFLFFRYSQSHKAQKCTATVLIMVLSVVSIISFNIVTISNDSITVNNYWGLKKQSYGFEDISSAELSLVTVNTKWHAESLKYEITFSDKKELSIVTINCYLKEDDSLLLFDKKISGMRKIKDDLSEDIFLIDKQTDVFYDYFSNINN